MDDREMNIDVLFRNGLKDYEVLPPPEVWGKVHPVIKKQQISFHILRSAAIITTILSLSFIAYRLSIEISTGLNNGELTLNPESELRSPGRSEQIIARAARPTVNSALRSIPSQLPVQSDNQVLNSRKYVSPENFLTPSATKNISIADNNFNKKGPDLISLNNRVANPLSTATLTPQFVPETEVQTRSERWTIAALVSPTYFANYNEGNSPAANELKSEEQPLISYTGGISLSYKINRKFSVQSGLFYSSYGKEVSGISSYGGFQSYDRTKGDRNFKVLTANGTIYTNNGDVFLTDATAIDRISTIYTRDVFDPSKANLQYIDNSLRQNFSFLELPVTMRYKIIDKTVDLNIIGGLSSNLLLDNSVYASLNGSRYQVGKTDGVRMITFSSSIGMGMEYSFTSNLSINLEPTFRYYLNSFGVVPGLKIHPYSFGIFSGVSLRF